MPNSPYDNMNLDNYPEWLVNLGESIAEKVNGPTTYASNWLHEQIVGIKYDMYSGFYNKACDAWQVVNSDFNMNISSAGSKLREGLTSFAYGTPYETIKRISEVGFVPVAVIILVVVFAWEIAQVAERANQTGDKMFSELVMALFKLVVAIIVFAHAFDMVTLNYVRKAIALALEGPMMIVLFALYPALYSYSSMYWQA